MTGAESIIACIDVADADGVVAALAPLDEATRRQVAPEIIARLRSDREAGVQSLLKTGTRSRSTLEPAGLAVLGVATLTELRKLSWSAVPGSDDRVIAVFADRRPPWLSQWVDYVLETRTSSWGSRFSLARELVLRGLCPKPETPWYTLALLSAVPLKRFGNGPTLRKWLLERPDLLEDEIWRIFRVEGGGENSLSARDKFAGQGSDWTSALLELANDGALPRGRLLDESLGALGRDLPAFQAGWFSRFHELLQPTQDERGARVPTYLALLGSPIPATVSFAVKALAKAGPLPEDELLGFIGPVLSDAPQGTAKAALRLLPVNASAAEVACQGLLHQSADVQAAALDFIAKAGSGDAELAASVAEMLPGITPSLRDKATALAGPATPAPSAAVTARVLPAATPTVFEMPSPVSSIDELVELCVGLMEQIDNPIDLERALDGVSRLCDQRTKHSEHLRPLAKRAEKLLSRREFGQPFVGRVPRADVCGLVLAWAIGSVPDRPKPALSVLGFLSSRVYEIAVRAARGLAQPLLSLPTERDGTIDPEVFEARKRELKQLGRKPDHLDEVQASLRVGAGLNVPDFRLEARMEGGSGGWLRVRLCSRPPRRLRIDAVPNLFAMALVPGPVLPANPHDYTGWVHDSSFGGGSEAVRWIAIVWPRGREFYFARGADLIGWNLNWSQAQWYARCFLEPLLLPTQTLGPMALLLLAVGLAAKEPGESGLATDVLVAIIDDGRLDAAELGRTLGKLMRMKAVLCGRLARTLGTTAGVSDVHRGTVAQIIQTAFRGDPAIYPRDVYALVGLLNELKAEAREPITNPDLRVFLRAISGSGKAARFAKQLLARG